MKTPDGFPSLVMSLAVATIVVAVLVFIWLTL
jgi:hypothetical protein